MHNSITKITLNYSKPFVCLVGVGEAPQVGQRQRVEAAPTPALNMGGDKTGLGESNTHITYVTK